MLRNNFLVAILPAAYAWQLYGWGLAIAAYLISLAALAGIDWTFIMRGWQTNRLTFARVALIIGIMIAIGLSAAQVCDARGCTSLF